MKMPGVLALVLILSACAGPRATQPTAAATAQQSAIEQRLLQAAIERSNPRQIDYKIQPGDLLEIVVFKEDDMNRTVRVGGHGTITFPLVGVVKLIELSVSDAESLLAKKLSEFLIKPQVTVLIKEYANKQVYVLGEVKKPGSLQLPTERRLTVLEAITLCGGFTDLAAPDRTKVLRNGNGQNQSIQIEITRITKQGDKSADIFLEPNDTVYVPQSFF